MYKISDKIKLFIKEHKILFGLNVVSFIWGMLPFLYCVLFFEKENKPLGFLFLIPVFVIFFVDFLVYKADLKFSRQKIIINIFAIMVKLLIIAIIQTAFALACFLIFAMNNEVVEYTASKDYEIAMKSVGDKAKTVHFPGFIPVDLKNAVFYKNSSVFFGGDIVYLRFNASKKYIESELKKHKYIKTEGPFDDAEKYKQTNARSHVFEESYPNKHYYEPINGYKLYVIGDNTTEKYCHRSCEYGIAVNDKTNTIIYYVSAPD